MSTSGLNNNNLKEIRVVKAWPFGIYGGVALILTLAGLLISAYLALAHYRVHTDISYESFCALTRAINCDTVSQSRYAVIGGIPVAIWGIWGYAFFITVLVPALYGGTNHLRLWSVLFVLAAVFSVSSIMLAAISTFAIHSYCLMCMATYTINFGLLFVIWVVIARFNAGRLVSGLKTDFLYLRTHLKSVGTILVAAIVVLAAIHQFIPPYWETPALNRTAALPRGITADGHPWIGARSPILEITVFSDYQCFQCRKMHYYLRHLIEKNPHKIRLVHRHYPMDHEFNPIVKTPMHVGSGKLALMAIMAAQHNRFWRVNDTLFALIGKHAPIDFKRLESLTGLPADAFKKALSDSEIRAKLNRDIIDGIKLKISGTPAFVIGHKVFFGQIPPEIIAKALAS